MALEYFEEKEEIDGNKDASKVYWSTCNDDVAEKIKNNLSEYISRLEDETSKYNSLYQRIEAIERIEKQYRNLLSKEIA